MGFQLATATAAPLFGVTLFLSGSPLQMVLGGLVTAAAMVPLALALADRVEKGVDRRFALVSIAVAAVAAAVLSISYVVDPLRREALGGLLTVATAGIALVPGLIAAGPLDLKAIGTRRGAGSLMRSTELALAGATPTFALFSDQRSPFAWPLFVWLVGDLRRGQVHGPAPGPSRNAGDAPAGPGRRGD